jgi:hypothetical protein
MTKFFAVENLVLRSLTPCCPWEFCPLPEQHPTAQIRGDKQSRQDWYRNAATRWQFYTAIEPSNPNQRCGKDNPTRMLHGFAADYDIRIPAERIKEAIASMPYKPQYIETSLGGNTRLVWVFERPVPVDDYAFCCFILEAAIEWLRLDLLPALDKPAFTDPARLLCNGAVWEATNHPPISESSLQAFLVNCGREFRFNGDPNGPEIPLDIVEGLLKEKFPNFSWPGDFVVDSQGPSFWIPESTSALSAIVKKDGMFTFSAHAAQSFYPWASILGAAVLKDFTDGAIAKATAGIQWDGKHFWRKKNGVYVSCEMTELVNYFKVNCRLSDKKGKEGVSMIDLALNHIWAEGTIHGAAPFVFQPHGLLEFNGKRVLNTYVSRVVKPADTPVGWGENFPFLAMLFDNLFDPPTQLPYYLAWYKHFYTSALEQIPAPGQNVFLMGGAAVGKTLSGRKIVGRSVGGFVDASEHMTGATAFDSEMYEVGLWCIDDETMSDSTSAHARFQAMLKKIAANQEFKHKKKFEVNCMTQWSGRAYVTTNLDHVSSRSLGSLDNTSADKTCVFRCGTESKIVFPARTELVKIIERELPWFLRWLLEWTPPDHVKRDIRYGYSAFHEATLLQQAYQSSKVAPFKELLVESLFEYFTNKDNKDVPHWRGTTTQLIRLLHENPLNDPVLRGMRLEQTTRWLEMIQREDLLNCTTETGPLKTRIWKFARFEGLPTVPDAPPAPAVSPQTNSTFQNEHH